MKTLTEFLKEHAEKQRNNQHDRRQVREEWLQSVSRLMQQLEGWLAEADPEHLLEIKTTLYEQNEEEIGHYTVPGLVVYLGGRRVEIVPRARRVAGEIYRVGDTYPDRTVAVLIKAAKKMAEANGRFYPIQGLVHLTDGGYRFSLYRIVDEQGEKWLISEENQKAIRPLDRTSFEEAIVRLLE